MPERPQTPMGEPYSRESERAFIGACLLASAPRDVLLNELDVSDFYAPAHQAVVAAIREMHQLGAGIDAHTVFTYLRERSEVALPGGIGFLVECQNECVSTRNARTYAIPIKDRAARRALRKAGFELMEKSTNLMLDVGDIADRAETDLRTVESPIGDAEPDLNIIEFLERPVEYNWLIPGLLERGDRLIITGAEGAGKSQLIKQLSVQFAAGIHPFKSNSYFDPVRVLHIDLENSTMQTHRKYEPMIKNVLANGQQPAFTTRTVFDPELLRVNVHPQGIDLLSRADRRWFTERVDANRPDVVLTGPIYKMHRGNPNDEAPAAQVAAYLDDLRSRYGCALILEAHSPHGNAIERTLRPYGASLWMRWPEFGFGLRPDGDTKNLVHWTPWRGARDDNRSWPARLIYGNRWPWVNAAGAPSEIATPDDAHF
jgi:AAA domain/DnaB-like helicase N terminal domain